MIFLYFDEKIKHHEKNREWDQALNYLEGLYDKHPTNKILNSLIGFSWYYLVEGPVCSRRYATDESENALVIWKKYIDVGIQVANDNQYFNFISGYTLSLHGFLINADYESKGSLLIHNCIQLADDISLKQFASTLINNDKSLKPKRLENFRQICNDLFNGDSLLERYFCGICASLGDIRGC